MHALPFPSTVNGIPETFFIDAQGVVREKHSG